jgi:signal transduction histidine kinase
MDEVLLEFEELRASRARVVTAADAERRRIERDLHDGAQQYLIALAVNLQLARRLSDSDPAAVKLLLEEIGQHVHEALDDVRRLAWRIYPSFLLDRGLVEALRAVAATAVISTRVEAKAIRRYSPEIEATVYFCCVEVLQAAADNSEAVEHATIRLSDSHDTLRFDVNVVGGGDEPWTKRSLIGVSDRLCALGGRLTITSATGGTCITGTITREAASSYSASAR